MDWKPVIVSCVTSASAPAGLPFSRCRTSKALSDCFRRLYDVIALRSANFWPAAFDGERRVGDATLRLHNESTPFF